MAELCDRYMEAARQGLVLIRFNGPKKASTLAIDVGRIERHIKPLIGGLPLAEVTGAVVRRLAADVAVGKTVADVRTGFRGRARVTGGSGKAARVLDLLSGIMAWAQEQELIDRNPVPGVKRYRGKPKDRFLSAPELARLGEVLRSGRNLDAAPINPSALSIVTLLLQTGCRGGEMEALRWSEVADHGAILAASLDFRRRAKATYRPDKTALEDAFAAPKPEWERIAPAAVTSARLVEDV